MAPTPALPSIPISGETLCKWSYEKHDERLFPLHKEDETKIKVWSPIAPHGRPDGNCPTYVGESKP